jgi:nitrate/nitrite transport system substrate-binding protein
MLHWNQLAVHVSDGDLRKVIRPDLFREAAASMGIDTPLIDSKTEGRHARPFTLNGRFGPVSVSSDALIGSRLHDRLAACRT